MALVCAITNEVPDQPVVSPLSGAVFERRIVEKYITENGCDPITGSELKIEQLIEIKTPAIVKPKPPSATSIPAILKVMQDEWDAIMLHTFTQRQQLQTARQELSHALYQHDASCRVIARLTKEVTAAREALATLKPQAGIMAMQQHSISNDNGPSPMDTTTTTTTMGATEVVGLGAEVIEKLQEKATVLTKERKKRGRTVPAELATQDAIKSYRTLASHPGLHSASAPGILTLDIGGADHSRIITGGNDKTAVIFSRDTEQVVKVLKGHSKRVTLAVYHPEAEDVAITASPDASIRVWHIPTAQTTLLLRCHDEAVTGLSLHPTGDYVLSTSADRHWAFSDVRTGALLTKVADPADKISKIKQLALPTPISSNHYLNITKTKSFLKIHDTRRNQFSLACIGSKQEVVCEELESDIANENVGNYESISVFEEERVENMRPSNEFGESKSIWDQILEIVKFSGPATGLWICGPLMSLIDTAVIGQGSSLELAALGPGTVLCDNMSYVFMFLSIATSNLVATSLAKQDKKEVQHQISILLFVGLTCGVFMFFFMKFLGARALSAFTGPKNAHLVPAANKYVQIRALAWPAVLVGWVAQSASLGMKDSWGPLRALAIASTINIIGHIVLCSYLGYGIAGAAWATMCSQVISAYMMVRSLNSKGYNGYAISIPSPTEVVQIFMLAAPVFLSISSKVAFYSLIIYFATSMGTATVAAHQVLIQLYSMCVVWGEPLSQTAQSFMPELLYGANRSLPKARMLLKSLVVIGVLLGLTLGAVGTSVPLLLSHVFTSDPNVTREMHKVLIPFFIALCVTPCTHSFEGTLLAGRDLKFISLTMTACFCFGSLLLLFVSNGGYGLLGCWCALVGFQWARFSLALRRLISPDGVLYSEDLTRFSMEKLKAI